MARQVCNYVAQTTSEKGEEMKISVTCSWCHHVNELSLREFDPVFCTNCGHRADLPRTECNCANCTKRERRLYGPRNSEIHDRRTQET